MNNKIIVKMIFGSKLYGTDTPESDQDYKGVILPTKEEILLGKIPKSYNITTKKGNEKNSKDDIDTEIFSLHYFLKLACEGQTIAFDMLHAPKQMWLETSDIWTELLFHRTLFYTKNLHAFVAYARKQAARYGVKGSRLNDCKKVIISLKDFPKEKRLVEIWNSLPTGEHIHFIEATTQSNNLRTYEICGKKFQESVKIEHILPILENFYREYGNRAIQAAKNEGIDFKACSHAIRAAFQIKQLLTENTITFPLKEAEFIKDVKLGKYHYGNHIGPLIDSLLDEVEELAAKSTLPEKVNQEFWDRWLIKTLEDNHFS